MKETMTIHKALTELKTLQSRIENEINRTEFVATNKHSNTKYRGQPVADYVKSVQDAYKSIRSMINRRNAIKQAITKSNAVSWVEIGGKTYTVAEAIDMKQIGSENLRRLAASIENQLGVNRAYCERENGEKLDARADQYIKNLYEGAEMKNLSEEVRKVREEFVASQTVDLIDPIGAENVLKELRDSIEAFMSDVDSALSVSNALTTIEVEYETL